MWLTDSPPEREMKHRISSSVFILFFTLVCEVLSRTSGDEAAPVPTPWPEQFHAVVFMNVTGSLRITDLWYDWRRGRNVNVHHLQLGGVLYAVEWNNGTSFYYTPPGEDSDYCRVTDYGVGIPRPDFLAEGANYLGLHRMDGFLCHVWEKLQFIWYYEDVVSRRPVRFDFEDMTNHVMTFEVGAVLEDSETQAPAYCFPQEDQKFRHPPSVDAPS